MPFFLQMLHPSPRHLSNPEKRRQFDSVDEGIDDEKVPTVKEPESKFFALWTPVFGTRSTLQRREEERRAPGLGDLNSTKITWTLLRLWYNFDSWRSFEYLDKEINEGSDSRDDKRYTEKKNRKRPCAQKEEGQRPSAQPGGQGVERGPAYQEVQGRGECRTRSEEEKGQPGSGAATPAQLAEQKKQQEEEARISRKRAKQAEADKAARADAKKAREAAKKNLKKHKKVLRDCITGNNYFEPAGTAPSASVIEAKLNGLDAICAALAERTGEGAGLRERAEKAGNADAIKKELATAAEEKVSPRCICLSRQTVYV